MATHNLQQKLLRYRIYSVARVITCVGFLVLAFIGASSLVQAMNLDHVPATEDGIPAAWRTASTELPESITVPITYWDQRVDACDADDRQFEWGKCHYWTKGALQGIVKPVLGSDHLPIPTFTNSDDAWEANHDIFTANVIGGDPVLPTDNFYRWFHEVDGLSRRVNGHTVTFQREGDTAIYTYGGQHIYPLDALTGFDSGDVKLRGADGKMHNFHFTGHLRIPMRIIASGQERFRFSGDDDVWVFLNDQLILDIGGLHEPLAGWFAINSDGTIDTHVNSVSNVADRTDELTECMKVVRSANSACNNDFNNFLVQRNQPLERTLDIGLSAGDVVYLDFFYAERSSDGSNTKITIENMDWPISANAKLSGQIVEQRASSNIVEYTSSLINRDPEHDLILERLASYINDTGANDPEHPNTGFIPLSVDTLYYTTTPRDNDSWTAVRLSAPANGDQGFALDEPLTLAPNGQTGDTLYFRYSAETIDTKGTIDNTVSYYTRINENSNIVHVSTTTPYERTVIDVPDPDPETPDPDEPTPATPTESNPPTIDEPLPPSDDLTYVGPLGEVAFVPNTGIVNSVSPFFRTEFASIILSQRFVMTVLLIFAIAFAVTASLRKYSKNPLASKTASSAKSATTPAKSAAKSTKSTSQSTGSKAKAVSRSTKSTYAKAKSTAKSSAKTAKKPGK